jgi:hypothetical protein
MIFSVQASSSASETVFSASGFLQNNRRKSLSPARLEQLTVIKFNTTDMLNIENYVEKFARFRIEANDKIRCILDNTDRQETIMEEEGCFDSDDVVFNFNEILPSDSCLEDEYNITNNWANLMDEEMDFLTYVDDEDDVDYNENDHVQRKKPNKKPKAKKPP